MSWHVCRICLAGDVKTYTIVDTQYQDIYEKITGYKWDRDDRPIRICYICKSQLQRSLKFQLMCKMSEETFDQILAVGFEFTEEILPILYKRRLQTVEISPISTVIIEPTENSVMQDDITDIKETGTQERKFKRFSISPISIACVGNVESSSSSQLQQLGISKMKIYTLSVDNDVDADEIKQEIKTIKDESNTEGSPEKILKTDTNENSSRKEHIKTEFQNNTHFKYDFVKSSTLKKKAFVYIPTTVIKDFSLDANCKSNHMQKSKNITPTKEAKILTNECNMSFSTPNKNTHKKSLTLTFKRNDIITPSKSLEKNAKQKKVAQESSKRNGIIDVLSVMDCNKSFTKKGQFLENYKESKLQENVAQESSERNGIVDVLSVMDCNKSFTKKGQFLENYIESKRQENKFGCNFCTRSFKVKSFLTLHMKIHNGDRQFECDKCPKTYTRLHYLNRHKLSHLSKKAFICKICQKSFNQRSNLNQHKRNHTGERPYSCKVCKKRFIQLSHLLQHNSVHSGEKPYSCICGKSFSQVSGLFHHRRTHNIVKPFKCVICARGFSQKTNLKFHLNSAHSLSLSALESPAHMHLAENVSPK